MLFYTPRLLPWTDHRAEVALLVGGGKNNSYQKPATNIFFLHSVTFYADKESMLEQLRQLLEWVLSKFFFTSFSATLFIKHLDSWHLFNLSQCASKRLGMQ